LSDGNYVAVKSYFSSVQAVSVDAGGRFVSFRNNQFDNVIQLHAESVDRKKWLTDCYTNTSYEILETWRLESSMFPHPYYIVAGCFGRNVIFITESLENDALAVGLLFEGKKH